MKEQSSYLHYSMIDLLNDDYFIESELNPTDESKRFWAGVELLDHHLSCEIQHARFFFKAVSRSDGKNLSEDEVDDLWKRIQRKNIVFDTRHKFKRILYWSTAVAAACVAIIAVYFHQYNSSKSIVTNDAITMVKQSVAVGSDVQLVLSNHDKLKIVGKESQLKYNKKGQIVVNTPSSVTTVTGATQYNQLIVPAGKRSSIVFSDGTRISVNANTRVVYPTVFATGKREIYVDGEVYLDVVHNDHCPFIVKTNRMDVQVLGTAFDVSTRSVGSVVLVRGRVQVRTSNNQHRVLVPGEMLSYKECGDVQIKNVDVSRYISWVDGYYEFQREPIQNVVDMLMQYYGKRVFVNLKMSNVTFSGKLDLRDDLDDVLETIAHTIPAQVTLKNGYYQLKDN